jgi:enolase
MSEISRVFGWEALDSRGTPTVGCEVTLTSGARGAAVVPSGASTGTHEAHELRDGGERYGGKGVRTAVANVSGPLAEAVRGIDACDQAGVDRALREADGTAGLARLGANAVPPSRSVRRSRPLPTEGSRSSARWHRSASSRCCPCRW